MPASAASKSANPPAAAALPAKKIGALVLAAGFSSRFGASKLLAQMPDGRTVYEHTLSNLTAAVPDILVVSRAEIIVHLPTQFGRPLAFPAAADGMGASLAFGIQQQPGWDACLVCLADMPSINTASYAAIRDALDEDRIVLPRYQGRIGNPVGFGSRFFPALAQLTGDQGGRAVVKKNPQALRYLDLDDPALLLDIDTPGDLRALSDA